MRVNICYPFIVNPTGGSFESTKLLIEHVDTDKINPTMVFGVDGSAATSARKAEIPTDIVPLPQPVLDSIREETELFTEAAIGFRLLPYILNLRGYLLNENVDLVHVNDGLAATIWGLAGRLAGIPVVWHVRSEGSNLWDSLRLRLVNQLIFVAESNERKFENKSIEYVESTVIHNAVDTAKFAPRRNTNLHTEIGIQNDTPIGGFVGNLVPRKRPMLFVRAATHAIDQGCPAHFVLVGEDQGNFEQEIDRVTEAAGVKDRIHLLGYRSEIPEIMRAMDILVLTSTERGEAFPRVPLEAMASGAPVISTDSAGVSEGVIDGETGLIVDPHIDPKELGDIITETLSDKSRLRRWAENGVTHVQTNFDAQEHANGIEEIYEKMIPPNVH